MSVPSVELLDIQSARQRIRGKIARTPQVKFDGLSRICECELYLKLELLQRCKSFKFRGALNKVMSLPPGSKLVAVSAGNHSQGVALAASLCDCTSVVYMPEIAAPTKVEATRGYGAEVRLEGADFAGAKAAMEKELASHPGEYVFVPPFDDPLIVAGAGTVGLEVLEDGPDVDYVVVPIGGGGLISGVACAIKALKPSVKIAGVQGEFNPAAYRAFHRVKGDKRSGGVAAKIPSLADGIAVSQPGALTLSMIEQYVDDIVLVTEDEITCAITMLLERAKIVTEGAGAASFAAVVNKKFSFNPTDKVVCVISGGNIPLKTLATVIERALFITHARVALEVRGPAGSMSFMKVVNLFARQGIEILACQALPHDDVVINEEKFGVLIAGGDQAVLERLMAETAQAGWLCNIRRTDADAAFVRSLSSLEG